MQRVTLHHDVLKTHEWYDNYALGKPSALNIKLWIWVYRKHYASYSGKKNLTPNGKLFDKRLLNGMG